MNAGYYYSPPSYPYTCFYPSPNADYTGSSAPPPYSAYSLQPYVTLPPMKATVDLPPLQIPVAPYYWDPNKPCAEPIPPSPKSDNSDDTDDSECKCGCDKSAASHASPSPYPYPYPYPYQFQYQYPYPSEKPEKCKRKPPTQPRKGCSLRKRKSLRSYGADLPFDSLNLAPRPTYWRPDYAPPHAAHSKSAKLRRFTLRGKFAGQRQTMLTAGNHTNYTLHSLIHYGSSSTHPIAYDIRQDPQTIDIQYLNLPRHSNDVDWYQVATVPPMHELHLYHHKLPWIITIRATQTNGITVGDIFDQIYENLSTRITRQDLYNDTLSSSDREEMTTAFYYRQGSKTGDGMLRMDFLGFDVVFQGLAKGKNGLLEIKTGPATAP
ncbi:hypothetical protein C0993_003983 [Termitomyces sp. T159_Od127]|nr:hypothetical protein C0993_003983 [Termitomyces sp. T159_Od127]